MSRRSAAARCADPHKRGIAASTRPEQTCLVGEWGECARYLVREEDRHPSLL